ncbi:MAG: hypothetical protein Q7K54_06350, partial [Candidatus Parcubacteria bacterium]|nr:hypothetical protein [Candidatus Parcubacteria bacterium]
MDKNNETKNKLVQTYAEDMSEAIENSSSGVIREIIQEQEKSEFFKKELSPESKKNKLFMLVSFVFVVLAIIILSVFYFRNKVDTVEPEKQFTPLIFNDSSTFVEVKDLTKDQLAQTVLNKVNATKVKIGGVEGIYLTDNKKIVGLREFVNLIQGSFIPGDNALIGDNFLTGVVNGATKTFFILMKVNSMSDVFNPLRIWENKMF